MGLRSAQEYISSLQDGRVVYYGGERVEDITTHKVLSASIKHAADLFAFQKSDKYKDMLVHNSKEYGEISKFFMMPKTFQDLLDRFELIYTTTRLGRGMFNIVKAIGSDAIFALMLATKRLDKMSGSSDYYSRVISFYKEVVEKDLALAVAQTDVKGNRSLRPHEQADPDMYVHITKRTDEGIYVSGAKVHITQAIAANEIIVIPTRAMTEQDKDYSVAFAVPANAPGLKMISRPMKAVESALRDPSFVMGAKNVESEALIIFDNVFIPWERVFLAGEYQFAGPVAITFPTYHRFTAISYRAAMADLFIGIAKVLSEYNAIGKGSHIRKDIVNLIRYKEALNAAAISASYKFNKDEFIDIAVPNIVMTNIGKLLANEEYTNAVKNLVDVVGGLAATVPSMKDLENPEIGDALKKYLSTSKANGYDRSKLFILTKEILSSFGALFTTAMIHAEGSIEASIIELYRSYDYEESKKLALYAAGLKETLD